MAKKDDEGLVRKAVFVPPTLWQRVKIEAAERNIDLSDIFTEMLSERYEATNRKEKRAGNSEDQRPNRQSPAFASA